MREEPPVTARYVLNAARSRFTVQAFAGGLLAVFGHDPTLAIRDFTGEVEFVPDTLTAATVRVLVKADSLVAVDNTSEKDRREIEQTVRTEALETDRYPEISLVSTAVAAQSLGGHRYHTRIAGELSLHGITRQQLVEATVSIVQTELRAQGEGWLKMSDYRIKPVTAAAGALKVKDKVKLSFDIWAEQERE